MSDESLDDQVSRLREIIASPHHTWVMPEDRWAIAMAARVLSVIQYADGQMVAIEAYQQQGHRIVVVGNKRYVSRSLLECFSEAGRALE